MGIPVVFVVLHGYGMNKFGMKIMKSIRQIAQFYIFVLQHFFQLRCNESAASLSYTSLLSLVPMMAVIFAAFSSFPAFNDAFEQLQNFIFNNLVPSSSEVIKDYLNIFVDKASKLTLVGLISLFVIALMLMHQIDIALNRIWDVHKRKSYLRIFLTYWAVLTLGPILIGMSIIVTSYLSSFLMIEDAAESFGLKTELLLIIPVLLTMSAFTLIYMIVPNSRVELSHALIGGVTATILFELAKKGFAIYVSHNQTYSNLYGALATIPIFLIWIYISWLVTLLGAMTARCVILFDFSHGQIRNTENHLLSVFRLLWLLYNASKSGASIAEKVLHQDPVLRHEAQLDGLIVQLEKLSWIHKTKNDKYSLAKDLDTISLWDLYSELPYALPKPNSLNNDSLSDVLQQANKLLSNEFDIPIKELFVQYDAYH